MPELIRECIGTLFSRRQGLRWLLTGAAASSRLAMAQTPLAAKRKKRKKRPKPAPPQPPTPSLEECRATCGDACDCLYTPGREIHCGAVAEYSCDALCQTGSECVVGTCIASLIPAGGTTAQLFDCDYRYGVCADEVACIG